MTRYYEFCSCVHQVGDSHWYRRYCFYCRKLFCGKISKVCPELRLVNKHTENPTYVCEECIIKNERFMHRLLENIGK